MIQVSVIIPVYNGEKHLKECMDSICGQTLRDIEIICVDDGSSDNSVNILKDYQAKDSRVQIYQQDHKYAGVARNLGKSHATGEYLAFWDCDDYFDVQALEKMYTKMTETDADIGVFGANEYLESKQKIYSHPACLNMKRVPDEDTFNRYTNPDGYLTFTNGVAWNKIFKHAYIEKQGLDFQAVRNGEDVYFTECALGLADRITCLNENLVTYRIDRKSGLVSTSSESPLSPIRAWIDIAEKLEQYDGFGERSFAKRALGAMIYLLANLRTWKSFSQAVTVLQEYGLKKMHIVPREKGYYESNWHTELVEHLYADTAEGLAVYMANARYIQYSDAKAEIREAKATISEQKGLIKYDKKRLRRLKSMNRRNEEKNKQLEEEISQIKNSWSFRIGKAIAWLPGKIKNLFSGSK